MNSFIFTCIMCLVWAASLLNGTGLGYAYNTIEITQGILICIALLMFLLKRRITITNSRYKYAYIGMTAVFIIRSLASGHGLTGLEYLLCFLLIYIVSNISILEGSIRLAGLAFAMLGLSVLIIFNYHTELSGWNPNSVAMIGLFSYLIFAASFFDLADGRIKLFLLAVTTIYFILIRQTGSRSSVLAVGVMLVIELFTRSAPQILKRKSTLVFILVLPLLVAGFLTILATIGCAGFIEEWSIETFNKPFLSGRDTLWTEGFERILQNPFFGSGEINGGYWHNSAITCIVAYGISGYFFWLVCLYSIIKNCLYYLSDYIVTGFLIVFIIIYLQQSLEIGLFHPTPYLIAYLPLGIMLGRIKYLEETYAKSLPEHQHNSTGIQHG